ncbi:transposase [Methylobacterium sp. AMS5]|nr:transposase [Methylobacterium sp. AMS5]
MFERLAHAPTLADRERAGREASPTGGILDARAARSGGVGVKDERGYDPARRVVGRKRHALTDTDGRLLLATLSTAGRHDSHSGVALLRASCRLWPFLAHGFADQTGRARRRGYSHHCRDRQA